MFALTRTSKGHGNLIKDMKIFDINAKLKWFNLDPIAIRSALGRLDAFFSGTFTLQLLLGTVWNDFDL